MSLSVCFCNNKVVAQTKTKNKTTMVKKPISEIQQGKNLISKSDCLSCHKTTVKLIGPSFHDIGAKYDSIADKYTLLTQKIIKGGSGNWGPMAMSPHPNLLPADIKKMVAYILSFK